MKRSRLFPWTAVVVALAVLAAAGPATATTAAPAGVRIDLRVLVISDGGPATEAIGDQLTAEGVPWHRVDLTDPARPTIDADFLADTVVEPGGGTVERARYQAVVLPSSWALPNPAEADALADYERDHGVRRVESYVWPSATVGLGYPDYSGPMDGAPATLTPAGLAGPFGYLRGPVDFEDISPTVSESWGYLAQPLPVDPVTGAAFTPLLTATSPDGQTTGALLGQYTADGRERLVLSFSYNSAQRQFRVLAPGIVDWATRGVRLGHHRNYFSVQVDDVLMSDSRWSIAGNCTPGDDCPPGVSTPDIRMVPADVDHAVSWQHSRGFTLDMAFNGLGSVTAVDEAPDGRDRLTEDLMAAADDFRWINHTYSHEFLGCVRDATVLPWVCDTDPVTGEIRYASQALIEQEITTNLDWADDHDLPLDTTELVTGEHSGLRILPQQAQHNPHLGPALAATGVAWLAADNSRMPTQLAVGSARTVPRHPINVFFNVATEAEQVDEYNWIYTSRADGGSGICEDSPATVTCITPLDPVTGWADQIIPTETRIALSHVLANDPRPHYVHQSNLTEDRLLYPLLDSVLDGYDQAFAGNTPIVCQSLADNGAVLLRQRTWADAVDAGTVTGHLLDGVLTVTAPAGVPVPVTAPEGSRLGDAAGPPLGTAYAGRRSGFVSSDGTPITVTLP